MCPHCVVQFHKFQAESKVSDNMKIEQVKLRDLFMTIKYLSEGKYDWKSPKGEENPGRM